MNALNNEQEKPAAEKARRSDQAILDDITNRLRDDPYLKEYDIHVTVVQGDVTLEGSIPSPIAENLVVEIVTGVNGVQQVHNLVQVGVGLDVQAEREAQGFVQDPYPSENPNTPTPGVQVPSTETASEVVPLTRESLIQDENMNVQMTGDNIQVTASGGVDATHVDDLHQGHEGSMAHLLKPGMVVVDSQGKEVGKVKEVRSTDFLLSRRFARDIYVPHLLCTLEQDRVALNVLADAVDEQGWAKPKLF